MAEVAVLCRALVDGACQAEVPKFGRIRNYVRKPTLLWRPALGQSSPGQSQAALVL